MLKLTVDNLSAQYADRRILNRISATFHGGQMTAVIGRNGVGKTTFIKAIAGQVKSGGTVRLADDEADTVYPPTDIAYLPQIGSASTRLTVFEMVLLGLVKNLRWRVAEEQIASVARVLEELNLSELSRRPFNHLSGGQKQLVSMAQSFVSRPRVLLLDEPTSALDLRHQLIVMDLAKEYTRKTGAITIFVVHDLMLASRYSDRMLLLDEARVKAHDTPENVLVPEVLQSVYNVKVSVEKTSLGYLNVVPVAPL
ncbi:MULTISPECIES: ABC transporter ATP-binding protein [Cohnella]|uniref:ABC transporter ATP-binding protein n=1 Tax=Cohnella TaxID=329857 RepID=UPI0009BB7747|nr:MULTISPECIES: ABC transporter ATP-binding protein [Cohnella]MBN2984206.1 ABC transporter ATP-binding protein [Cohnella algarum]